MSEEPDRTVDEQLQDLREAHVKMRLRIVGIEQQIKPRWDEEDWAVFKWSLLCFALGAVVMLVVMDLVFR